MRRDVFQAIADPVRRDILAMISQNEMTPNTVSSGFGISRQAISKHMQILTECGLLNVNIRGREYYYSIDASALAEVDAWLAPFRIIWENKFDQLDQVLSNLKNKKNGNHSKNPNR